MLPLNKAFSIELYTRLLFIDNYDVLKSNVFVVTHKVSSKPH